MLSGDPYRANDPELVAEHLRARALMDRLAGVPADRPDLVRRLLVELLNSLGEGTDIRPPLYCDYGSNLSVGDRTFINFGLTALDAAVISIGDDVQIGPQVQLLTPTHPVDAALRRAKWEAAEPIHIEDNVWLGGGCIVLPGVTIGEDTVVGAGAVVTKSLPARVVAVGNPAHVIHAAG